MTNNEIKDKYVAVEGILEEAVSKAENIELVGDEENAELSIINKTLTEINESFKDEIEKLEASSEWDKLCIAFFGETNAGKSTIIESLRIIYDEEQRRCELDNQNKEYEILMSDHCDRFSILLKELQEINKMLAEKKKLRIRFILLKILGYVGFIFVGFVAGIIVSDL